MDVLGVVTCIIKVGKEISEINEKVSSNQSSCGSLAKRISGIFEYIQHLQNEDSIYLTSLEEVMKVLEEAKAFMTKFVVKKHRNKMDEFCRKVSLIRTRKEDSESFCELNERLTLVCQDLNLGIQVSALNISIEGCEDNKIDVEDMRDMINSLFEEVRGNQELLKELNDANVSFVDVVSMYLCSYLIHCYLLF